MGRVGLSCTGSDPGPSFKCKLQNERDRLPRRVARHVQTFKNKFFSSTCVEEAMQGGNTGPFVLREDA